MAKSENVQFEEYHIPGLKAGEYTVEIQQRLEGTDASNNAFAEENWKAEQRFYVAGERYMAPLSDIHAVFPPDGNNGEHDNKPVRATVQAALCEPEMLVEIQVTAALPSTTSSTTTTS